MGSGGSRDRPPRGARPLADNVGQCPTLDATTNVGRCPTLDITSNDRVPRGTLSGSCRGEASLLPDPGGPPPLFAAALICATPGRGKAWVGVAVTFPAASALGRAMAAPEEPAGEPPLSAPAGLINQFSAAFGHKKRGREVKGV